jgi:hypothetical protein
LRQYPTLSLRKLQPISAARIKGFTPENVVAFLDIFEKEIEKIKFSPNRVFNVDETGITVVQYTPSRVETLKGKKEESAERGALVTLVTCMGASGIFVPPLVVFPRKNMKLELLNGTPQVQLEYVTPQGGFNWKFSPSGSNISLQMWNPHLMTVCC